MGASELQTHQLDRAESRGPRLLVTIDAEGDNLWSRPRAVSTRNAAFVGRFQSLCERFRLKPTYLTTYEMATCPRFVELVQDALSRGQAEVGMHLHAWNSPPLEPLTKDDARWQPFLTGYPVSVMRDKIARLTDLLEETFGTAMISHRAGRWGFDGVYGHLLVERGYQIDSSVTPNISWRRKDAREAVPGPDYTGFPERPYYLDLSNIMRAGDSDLLEVPVTTQKIQLPTGDPAAKNGAAYFVRWLRPNGRNLNALQSLLEHVVVEKRQSAVMMLHSSELMPGGSPTFPDDLAVERLYADLESLFAVADGTFQGVTMSEFGREMRQRRALGRRGGDGDARESPVGVS